MRLWLGRWSGAWQHLRWRLSMMLPMLFTQYASAEEVHAERSLSGWKLGLIAVLVLSLSVWSFTL